MKILNCEVDIKFEGKFFTLIIEYMKRKFEQKINFPEFVRKNGLEYCIYKNSIYATLLYIVPPVKRIQTFINSLDIESPELKKYTIVFKTIQDNELNENYSPSILQIACGYFENIYPDKSEDKYISGPLFMLDKWKITSSKDIATVLFNQALYNTVANLKNTNSLQSYHFDNSIQHILNVHRWSGIETDCFDLQVHKANTSVIFPNRLLDLLDNPVEQIITKTIDMASYPSNTKNDKYHLCQGVQYVENNKEFKSKIGLPTSNAILGLYESGTKHHITK